jgi:RNA polymerase sigma-70 factor (ECF subfamily)
MLAKRRQKSRPSYAPAPSEEVVPDPNPGPEWELERSERAFLLRELLEQLPAGQREVIRQRVYEGKRFREIAAALGCPLNTALARMHEGLKKLRLLWEQNHA